MPNKDMSIDHRFEYLKQQYERYHAASREDKGRLLDEMTTYTGMHRKTVIRLMRSEPKRAPAKPRYKRRIYGTDVERVIRVIAKALDYPCRERLTPMLPTMADHLSRLGVLEIEAETQELLERISVSTVGRIMTRVRQDEPRLRRRAQNGRVTRVHAQVPIRTIPWYQSMPGHLEADLVQHSGPNSSGEFLYTLQLVDVATGWSELAAVLGKSYRVISDGFKRCLARLPFAVHEVHTDNGTEFLNSNLLTFWHAHYPAVALSRSRPYQKQDNRFVEHRNGALVRALLGHDRFDTARHAQQLNHLYNRVWLYFNFFQPVMRQTEKTYEQGHVRRRQKDVRTPFQRLCAADLLSPDQHGDLEQRYQETNPLQLRQEIDHLLASFFALPNATPGQTEDIFDTLLPQE